MDEDKIIDTESTQDLVNINNGETPVTDKKLPTPRDKSPRELVEEKFIELGFTDENPSDLDMVAELLQIWRDNDDDKEIVYSPEQYMLLNDPDVKQVLIKCKEYYEPKRHMTQGELMTILEDIARGKITRKDYDFKNGEVVNIEPTFSERITAIKMLQDNADDDDTAGTVQFINNIISPTPLPKPNITAPTEPPPGHYSLKLGEGDE